jgi:hypothetical protein
LIDKGTSPESILQVLNSEVHGFSQTASAVRLAQKTMEAVAEQDLPVCSIYQPLADAGGDTFSCVHLPNGEVMLVLADRGIPSSVRTRWPPFWAWSPLSPRNSAA